MTDERRVWIDDRGREHLLCEALTKSKRRCKAAAVNGPFCATHDPSGPGHRSWKAASAREYAERMRQEAGSSGDHEVITLDDGSARRRAAQQRIRDLESQNRDLEARLAAFESKYGRLEE